MDEIALLRALHLTGAVLLLGNVTVTGFWATFFYRARQRVPFRPVARAILWTDLVFTLGGGTLLTVSGILLAMRRGYTLAEERWLLEGIGALAIAGIFPLAGFFSKDEILFETFLARGPIVYGFALAGAGLTAFYMFRLMGLTFYGPSRLAPGVHPHESPRSMTLVLTLLAGLSVAGGWVGISLIPGWNQFAAFLAPVFADAEHIALTAHHGAASHGLELALAGVSLVAQSVDAVNVGRPARPLLVKI